MKKLILSVLFVVGVLAVKAEGISSPSGKVTLDFQITGDGVPVYEVNYKGHAVIKSSKLGLELKDAKSLQDGFKLLKSQNIEIRPPGAKRGQVLHAFCERLD